MNVTGCDDCLCRTLALGRAYCVHPGLAWGQRTARAGASQRPAALVVPLEQSAEEIEAAKARVVDAIMNADLGGGGEYYYHPRLGLYPAWAADSTGTYAGLDRTPLRDAMLNEHVYTLPCPHCEAERRKG